MAMDECAQQQCIRLHLDPFQKLFGRYDAVLSMSDDGKKTLYALDFSKESQ